MNRRMKKLNPNEEYTLYEVDAAADENEDIFNYDDVDDPGAFA